MPLIQYPSIEAPSRHPDRFRGLVFRGIAAGTPRARSRVRTWSRPGDVYRGESGQVLEEHVFLDYVFGKAGLAVNRYRRAPLLRRIPACLRTLKATSLDQAKQRLEKDSNAIAVAVDALLIGATAFYRDVPVFDYLREQVLPSVNRSLGRARILSAACSDGAEAYTFAMLLDEADYLAGNRVCGIDCRQSAIDAARRGIYPASSLRQLPTSLASKYLMAEGNNFRIAPQLQRAIQWSKADIRSVAALGRWDIICCRNLAIYLTPSAATDLWRELITALRPQGYLVVGKAEKPLVQGLAPVAPCIYQKRRRE